MTHPIHWGATARPGDIAMFRFPLGESDAEPKARPCLIVARCTDGTETRLTVAYGTSAPTDANRGRDLIVADPLEAASVGLHRPTRFVLARRITVPAGDARFACGRQGSAVVGSLPQRLAAQMQALVRELGLALTQDSRRGDPPSRRALAPSRRIISRRTRSGGRAETVVVEARRRRA